MAQTTKILLNNLIVELVKTEAGHYLIAENAIDAIQDETRRLREVEAGFKLLSWHFKHCLEHYENRRDIEKGSISHLMLADFGEVYENYKYKTVKN